MSLLLLIFLVPAVVFGAVAGVYVDRSTGALILVATNVARGCSSCCSSSSRTYGMSTRLLSSTCSHVVATLTTFFAPAEAAMIPDGRRSREQLLTANGLFIFALQASFVSASRSSARWSQRLGRRGADRRRRRPATSWRAALCWLLPAGTAALGRRRLGRRRLGEAERAIGLTSGQLREGLALHPRPTATSSGR